MMRRALALALALPLGGEVFAQKAVNLQLRPRIGDTVWMRLEQQTELSSRGDINSKQALATTTTVTYSRAVVESGVAASTTVVAITDSIFVLQGAVTKAVTPMTRQAAGQRVRLRWRRVR